MKELGEVAYNAYCAERDWKSLKGEPLPRFKDQLLSIQHAWNVAAIAVVKEQFKLIQNYIIKEKE